MADTQAFEAWWRGRGLPEGLKPAFFMVWQAALASRPAEVGNSPVDQASARVRYAEAGLRAARKDLADAMTTAARTND